MKMFSVKACLTALTSAIFAFSLLMPVAYGHDRDKGHHWGFDKGYHWGHHKGKGKHKGHSKEGNPWYWYYADNTVPTGVDLSVSVNDLSTGSMQNVTVNSLKTVKELLEMVLGTTATDGYYLQECYAWFDPRNGTSMDNCETGEMPVPLNGDMTLENAGVVDGEVLFLLYLG